MIPVSAKLSSGSKLSLSQLLSDEKYRGRRH